MKGLFALIIIFAIPFYSKAQVSELGKTKEEIRSEFKSGLPIVIDKSESDTQDSFDLAGDWHFYYYYKNDTCYRIKQVYPFNYQDVLKIPFTASYKKIKKNTWIDSAETVKVELIARESKSQCILEINPIKKIKNN